MRAAMIMAITASAVVGRSAGGPPGGDASKVAIVGNRTVTRAELEERVRPKLIQIENQRYEALSDGLNELIADELEKQEAVVRGIGRTGRLVTSAALILFLAFISMASGPDPQVKIFATGLAAGIMLDATVIRALLVPSLMRLLGGANWWLPSWTARALRLPEAPASDLG